MQATLEPAEADALLGARHRPMYCLRVLTEVILSADLMEGQAIRMDENLSFFEEQVGTCERCGLALLWGGFVCTLHMPCGPCLGVQRSAASAASCLLRLGCHRLLDEWRPWALEGTGVGSSEHHGRLPCSPCRYAKHGRDGNPLMPVGGAQDPEVSHSAVFHPPHFALPGHLVSASVTLLCNCKIIIIIIIISIIILLIIIIIIV